ncbi:quinone-dependent dihydroorotate dehydrogenase [Paraglaciecola hydrolytica]|uniref:Dihydroorotate dehydrogenase (quinone) n=1 Tax=Paraglaciecola hydrolytica TaxID=1799789 RepID=A0A136A1F6_9ALTE|nr:quinone-dependent dihydroorotate dehydrogenase [Paraglaciecola hydrolytica]KXI29054.1 dihydroorotate dehydrogenase [Paraglaciecola hydrolytica]
MYSIIQKALFTQDAEWSHDFTINWLRRTQNTPLDFVYRQNLTAKPVEVMGLKFKNPLGLAAGLDKNGECIDAFAAMGFGFIEIGTVTPRAQAGNDKPRMFRLPAGQAIINRMGFNNKGVDNLVANVKKSRFDGVLGINIGKNKDTPEEAALSDYLSCLQKVYEHASYVTINISSPNTPGLRNLQHGNALNDLLSGLKTEQLKLADKFKVYRPVLVKIAPDLSHSEIENMASALIKAGIDGVIATNTTLDRSLVEGQPNAQETGGLSGAVLTTKSQQVALDLASALGGAIPMIGVGGIHDAASAKDRINAGSSLIQLYSSLIYRGPQVIKEIVESL